MIVKKVKRYFNGLQPPKNFYKPSTSKNHIPVYLVLKQLQIHVSGKYVLVRLLILQQHERFHQSLTLHYNQNTTNTILFGNVKLDFKSSNN